MTAIGLRVSDSLLPFRVTGFRHLLMLVFTETCRFSPVQVQPQQREGGGIIAVDEQHDNHSRNRLRRRCYCRPSNNALDSAVDRRSSGEAPGQTMGI